MKLPKPNWNEWVKPLTQKQKDDLDHWFSANCSNAVISKHASMVDSPKSGDVLQLRSDLWLVYSFNLWRLMTDKEMLDYD